MPVDAVCPLRHGIFEHSISWSIPRIAPAATACCQTARAAAASAACPGLPHPAEHPRTPVLPLQALPCCVAACLLPALTAAAMASGASWMSSCGGVCLLCSGPRRWPTTSTSHCSAGVACWDGNRPQAGGTVSVARQACGRADSNCRRLRPSSASGYYS